ncbi:hypothetical protein DIY14_04585, partial [Streptococcus iniae]
GNQAVQTEVGFLFMSMNLTKLAKNLDSKTSNTQKPHSDFFILIVFKTEISAWFYLKLLFAQPLLTGIKMIRRSYSAPSAAIVM